MTIFHKKRRQQTNIVKIIIIFIFIIPLFLPEISAQTNVFPSNYNNNTNKTRINEILQSNSKIYGIVREAVCCIPEPLENASVTAIRIGSLGCIKYQTTTDKNGNYTISLPAGPYRIFAHKDGYRRTRPLLWWILIVQSDQSYERNFILVI